MSKFGIVNMSMVITEEKILSNIDKVQKLINPNSKKQIIELEEDSYFKDLVESIKTYLIEYPKKKNFPVGVYKSAYGLVEFATSQFEENTKKIENLIKQREENIVLSGELKETLEAAENKEDGWKEKVSKISSKIDDDITENLKLIGKSKEKDSTEYKAAYKMVKARVNNLESNLHIEIDMERLEDSSKALSYIGIEVADALKLIPAPEEQLEAVAEQNVLDEEAKKTELSIEKEEVEDTTLEELVNETLEETATAAVETTEKVEKAQTTETTETQDTVLAEQQQYEQETTFEAKPSLWQRFKNSKIVRAATYVFRIKVRIELPSNALPEGRGEN